MGRAERLRGVPSLAMIWGATRGSGDFLRPAGARLKEKG